LFDQITRSTRRPAGTGKNPATIPPGKTTSHPLLLPPTSPTLHRLRDHLQLPSGAAPPDTAEPPRPAETAEQLTRRLALTKARALAGRYPQHLIIGSDQVLLLDGQPVSKPGNHAAALDQLRRCSGRTVRFSTALCLLNSASGDH